MTDDVSISALIQEPNACPEALKKAHHQLESRLSLLTSRRSISPQEHYEIQVLKKRKLAIKDQLSASQRR